MSTKTVTLDKQHRHGDKDWPIGTDLTLSTRLADWLISQNVAHEKDQAAPLRRAVPMQRGKCCGRR